MTNVIFWTSFAEYYNPKNQQFGVLRVLNDDLVKVKLLPPTDLVHIVSRFLT